MEDKLFLPNTRSEIYERLWPKTLKHNDILPVGLWETLPVERTLDEYPLIAELPFEFDGARLHEEFVKARRSLSGARDMVANRQGIFLESSSEEIMNMLLDLGFSRARYAAYPMRRHGSADLLECVGEYTRRCLDSIGSHFRQLYVMAQGRWISKPHVDNRNMDWHGFKIHLPVNQDGYIGFISEGQVLIHRMRCGRPYFCNTAVTHFGINPSSTERLSMIFQIASDRLIRADRTLEPFWRSPAQKACLWTPVPGELSHQLEGEFEERNFLTE